MIKSGCSGGVKLEAYLKDAVRKLSEGKKLRVGFLKTAKYPDGTQVAQVAYWNEYGTEIAPPRPFLRQTIAEKSPKWGEQLGKVLVANGNDVDKTLGLIGMGISEQIVSSVVEFSEPENATSTIAKKGFNKPLIDTGTMQRSVDFDIEG